MQEQAKTAGAAQTVLDGESDDALMERYAAGDMLAARLLAERHSPRLMGLAVRMLSGDRSAAEDVVQEAMMRLWRQASKWETGGAQLSTWLYRVVSNLCIDQLRRSKRLSNEPVPERADEDTLSAQEQIEQSQRAQLLRVAIDSLPERQRMALTLRHFAEMSNPDIAKRMEISVEAVESLLSRARRTLASKLRSQRGNYGLE